MTRTSPYSAPALAVLSILAASCTGTETGNPPFTAELGFTAYSSDSSIVAVDAPSATGLRLEQSWLVFRRMQFVPVDGTPPPSQVPALGAADHASDSPTEQLFELGTGNYSIFKVPFELGGGEAPAEAPEELDGSSIVLIGTLADGTEVRIAIQEAMRVDVRAVTEIVMTDESGAVLLGFDVATWLQNVDFSTLTQRDGRIHVSRSENAVAHDQILANIGAGLTLFRDPDGDGRIDVGASVLGTGS